MIDAATARRWAPMAGVVVAALLVATVPQPRALDGETAAARQPITGGTPTSAPTDSSPPPSTSTSTTMAPTWSLPDPSTSMPLFPMDPGPPFVPGDPGPPTPPVGEGPLRVETHGWATADTQLAALDPGVPEGSMPVGARLGDPEKVSYGRVVGGETLLRLKLHADPGTTFSVVGDAVMACALTVDTWKPVAGGALDTVPPYDEGRCVYGAASADGTAYEFDLVAFPHRATRGIAFVPAPASDADTYRWTFDPAAAPSQG